MEFTRHQDDLALSRFREVRGFRGDRVTDVALRSLHGPNADLSAVVLERCDFGEADLSSSAFESTTFVSTNLRGALLSESRASRVELYFSELNEADWTGFHARRLRVHGCQAMNVKLDRSRLAVARFEETPLIRASFRGATLVRVSFSDSRTGGAPLDRSAFDGATLIDCDLRGASLRAASFRRATLVGCDFTGTLLEATSFRGATLVGTALPVPVDLSPETEVEL